MGKSSKRLERLQALEDATKEYVKAEKERIESEVKVLEAILNGRTSGAGAKSSSEKVSAIAFSDLASFLGS